MLSPMLRLAGERMNTVRPAGKLNNERKASLSLGVLSMLWVDFAP